MKYLLPLGFVTISLFSSCASIFNSRNMKVQVSTAHPCYLLNSPLYKQVIVGHNYLSYYSGDKIPLKPHKPIYVVVARDKEPLRMEFVDSLSSRNMVEVRSKLSWVYYLNFGAVYPFPGIGFLGDISTPKKWEYDNDVFVDMQHPHYTLVRHSDLGNSSVEDVEDSKVTYTKGTPAAETSKVTFTKGTPAAEESHHRVTFTKESSKHSRKKKHTPQE